MEGSAILFGLAVLAYIFLSPLVLIILFVKQRRRISELEELTKLLARKVQATTPAPEDSEKPAPLEPVTPVVKPVGAEAPVAPVVAKPLVVPPVPEKVEVQPKERPVEPGIELGNGEETIWGVAATLQEFLQGVGMWPPKSGAGRDRETILMQWWLPRVGGVLALLSALFFGVYINQNTAPLFKLLELVGVSLGVAGLGWFMERRYTTFGGVLLATGLIMLYLSSVAAYVLPATRVIEDPLVGSLVQTVVLVGICVLGLLRRSSGLVLLTFHFGYFLSIFMAWEGLREGALIAAGLLFFAGLFLSRRPLLRHLLWVIIPGSYLVVLAFPVLRIFRMVEIPGNIPTQIFINVIFAAIAVLYFLNDLGKGRWARILISAGSSLAILSTLFFFRTFYTDGMEWAALVLGINMLVGSTVAWTRRGCGFLAQLLFVKATFLMGVWAVMYFAGDLRWMILGLQTVVVAAAARRARAIAMELAVWAVAIVSLYYYSAALESIAVTGGFTWWMMVAYPAVVTLGMSFLLQPLPRAEFSIRNVTREWGYALVPVTAIVLWNLLFENSDPRNFDMALPFVCILYVGAGLALIPFLSRWMLVFVSALAFVAASLYYWSEPFSILILIALVVASMGAIHRLLRKGERWSELAECAVYILVFTAVSLWVLQMMNDWKGQASAIFLMCVGIVAGGLIPRIRHIGSWAFLPLLVFMITEGPASGAGIWNLAAYACALGWLAFPVIVPKVTSGLGFTAMSSLWSLVWAVFFWLYVLLFGDPEATWMAGQWVLGVLGILLLAGAYRWSLHGYLIGALLFVCTAAGRHAFALLIGIGDVPWTSEVLFSAGLLYAFALIWFFFKPNPFHLKHQKTNDLLTASSSALAALLLFGTTVVTFQYKELGWTEWYTPILAVTAFIIILLGLFRSDSVFRRFGIAALAIPLVRLFLVDVQDALHRIIAFAAAAVLLTLLGYLYHRLASRLGSTGD